MKNAAALLVAVILSATVTWAQSLQEMNSQYDPISPLPKERISTKETVAPDQAELTPAEEQLAELKQKEEEQKEEVDQLLYLDTDFRFFQTLNLGLDEDELDKAYQQLQVSKNISEIVTTEKVVKTELKKVTPQTIALLPSEARAADTRRESILRKIATNVKAVKSCVVQNKNETEPFKGTELTLTWELDATGKVAHAQVKTTDLESKVIQDCILKSIADLNFNEVTDENKKSSQIEYTYRFTSEQKKELASK